MSRTGVVVSEGTGDSTGVVATDNGFSGGSTSICSDSGDPGSSVSDSGSGDIERSYTFLISWSDMSSSSSCVSTGKSGGAYRTWSGLSCPDHQYTPSLRSQWSCQYRVVGGLFSCGGILYGGPIPL